jgi:hypothetical protein
MEPEKCARAAPARADRDPRNTERLARGSSLYLRRALRKERRPVPPGRISARAFNDLAAIEERMFRLGLAAAFGQADGSLAVDQLASALAKREGERISLESRRAK